MSSFDTNQQQYTNMEIPYLMQAENTSLIIIDIQKKLLDGIANKDSIINNIEKLIQGSKLLGIDTYITEQNPTRLGKTINNIPLNYSIEPISKMEFSCKSCLDLENRMKNKRNILLCGIETHVCILQSSFDLLARGYQVYIAVDCIGSRNSIDSITAIKRMNSKGINITTAEASLFEWCATANHPQFKSISKIIKS